MVHFWMLPGPQRHLNNRECCCSAQIAPQGCQTSGGGDLNVNLAEPEGYQRKEKLASALTTAGMEDMLNHFLPQWCAWFQDGRTWIMVRAGREVRSRTDYILGTDRPLFRNVTIRHPHHNLHHYLVLGCLRGAPLMEQFEYFGRLKQLPLRPLTTPTREDSLFAALRRDVP